MYEAFVKVSEEIDEEGSEFDFRYSLVDHLFTDALGWTREEGEGHVKFEEDRKDVLCYDDSDPPFPVVVCETKRPSHEIQYGDVEQLEGYMKGVGSAKYGILTNGHSFNLYRYDSDDLELSKVGDVDIGRIANADGPDSLSEEQQTVIGELEYFRQDRHVALGDADYFQKTYQEVPVGYQTGADDEGYEIFLEAIKDSLDELTDVMIRFFEDYKSRDEGSYPKDFLETTFPDWQEWREYTGKSDDAKETFCRETAYIVLNRTLFARIAEDKEIVGRTRLSSRGMANAIEMDGDGVYLEGLLDTYDEIDDHYPDLYELGIFDWWWVSKDKRGQFSDEERRKQQELDEELNYALATILKRLNRFDFEYVNRDILGHVYEDYLPKEERKELGEYYTPLEVVQYMLDSTGYRATESIGRRKVLDPACGSGTFLTEVTERLINHFLKKFDERSVHGLSADDARTVLERVEENVYGIDINPFAAHITQINLLFRTIDLYDKVTEKNPDYTMDGFEIHVADTLSPSTLEEQEESPEQGQSSLQQFADYNGRAQSFIDDRDAVDRLKDDEEFDLVVANPPYVRIQNLSDDVKETYSARYATAIKNFDIYVPFIERGLDWLSEDGKLAYICPNRLFTNDYAEEIRNRLGEEPITHLIDFKDTEVFDAATPYPCILSVDMTKEVDEDVKCARFAEEMEGVLEEIYHLDEWSGSEEAEEYDLFKYPQQRLREDNQDEYLKSWKPMPPDEREVHHKLAESSRFRLGEITDSVFQGLITGWNKVFVGEIVKEEDGIAYFVREGGDEPEPVEKQILRRLLKGNEIDHWGADWEGLWLLFPYEIESGDVELLSQRKLERQYPKTWEFFKRHEEELKAREGGKWEDEEQWWAFGRSQNLSKMEPDKIMTNIMSSYNRFVADTDGEYYFIGGGNAGGYGIQLTDEYAPTSEDHLYYVALLNSQVLEFYHKHISPIFGGKYYSYNKRYLEPHPIVLPSEGDSEEEITQIADSIQTKRQERTDLQYRTSDILNYLADYDRASTVLDLADSIDLDDDDYRQDPMRKNDKMEVDTEEVYQVVMKRGHTIDFGSESVRDFVYDLLKAQDRRLGRSEILNTEVPTEDDVLELMDEYRDDEEEIERLESEAEELQEELDDIILSEVYELDEEDVEVIDEFLEVW
ncbi:N-6 DNA methylase [Haladaptatus sp. F3-133]|uniref:site-specific DNA-methyltransferase (adenine-specific) n=1 Tax=Halorutilus salinus TaxID=2487751 RepID=A0A9Q4C695_9EURY|nr:N-6 DNA methylase [Halorutilus salinus]